MSPCLGTMADTVSSVGLGLGSCQAKLSSANSLADCWCLQSHPEASNPTSGPTIPWTSGVLGMVAPQDGDDSRFLVSSTSTLFCA